MRAGGCPRRRHSEEKPPPPAPWPRWQLAGGEASPAPRKLPIREFALGTRVSSEDAAGWAAWARCHGSRRRAPRPAPAQTPPEGGGRGRHGMVLGEDGFPRRWGCARALGSASRQPLVIAALADRFSVDAGNDPAMTLPRPEIRAPRLPRPPRPSHWSRDRGAGPGPGGGQVGSEEGWPGDRWRWPGAGGDPLTPTPPLGLPLPLPLLGIKLPVSQPLRNESGPRRTEALWFLLPQIQSSNPSHLESPSFRRSKHPLQVLGGLSLTLTRRAEPWGGCDWGGGGRGPTSSWRHLQREEESLHFLSPGEAGTLP